MDHVDGLVVESDNACGSAPLVSRHVGVLIFSIHHEITDRIVAFERFRSLYLRLLETSTTINLNHGFSCFEALSGANAELGGGLVLRLHDAKLSPLFFFAQLARSHGVLAYNPLTRRDSAFSHGIVLGLDRDVHHGLHLPLASHVELLDQRLGDFLE